MPVTYNSGTDTVTLSGTEASPDTLDAIVAAVANTAKASKVGGYTYFFSFAVLNGANGFLRFDADTVTAFTSTRWDKNGSTGGMIFRERSIVRHEGNGFDEGSGILAETGYKVIAYRDSAGVNPRFILATQNRYDFLASRPSPVNRPTFIITGLDLETTGSNSGGGVSASLKLFTSVSSSVSRLRVFSRDSLGCEFQAISGAFAFLELEGAGIAMSLTAAQTLTLTQPTFNFKGVASPLTFNFNNTGTVEIQDPLFPNGIWNGNYGGSSNGFRGSSNCIANISYTSKLTFLSGSIPRQLKARHTRNDAQNTDSISDANGVISQLLLTSTRNGTGFSVGIAGAIATYNWSIKARKYDYKVAASTDVLYSANSFSSASSLTVQCSLVPFLTLTEAQALAVTGISLVVINAALGTASISASRSAAECWQYYRQFIANFTNFGSNDTWDYDGSELDLGAWNITLSAALTGKIKTSGTITLNAGGSVTSAITASTTIAVVQPGNTNLQSWSFAIGSTINAASGIATVIVDFTQIANIIPGTGVSIVSAPVTFNGFPTAANINGYAPQSVLGIKNQRTNVTTTYDASSGSVSVSVSTLGIVGDMFTIVADARGYYRTPLVVNTPITFSGTFNFANLFKAILDSDNLPICGLGIPAEMARLAYNQPIGTFEVDGGGVSFASVVQKVDEITSTQAGLTQFDTIILRQLTSESNPYARTIYLPVPLKIQANATTTTSPVFTDFIIVVADNATGDPYTHSARPEIRVSPTKIIVDASAIANVALIPALL